MATAIRHSDVERHASCPRRDAAVREFLPLADALARRFQRRFPDTRGAIANLSISRPLSHVFLSKAPLSAPGNHAGEHSPRPRRCPPMLMIWPICWPPSWPIAPSPGPSPAPGPPISPTPAAGRPGFGGWCGAQSIGTNQPQSARADAPPVEHPPGPADFRRLGGFDPGR